MKSITKKALFTSMALALAGSLQAAPITQWTVATYTRFDTASVTSANDPTGVLGNPGITISAQSLSWGTGGVSGIDITQGGTANTATDAFQSTPVFTDGAGVDNVIITHRNLPITGNTLSSVNILSTLWITPLVPAGGTAQGPLGPVTFEIKFLETPNNASPCANGEPNNQGVNISGCGDIFVIDQSSLNFSIFFTDPEYDFSMTEADNLLAGRIQNREYFLSFFEKTGGFKPLSNAACTAAGAATGCLGFVTPESQNTPAPFAVTITSAPIQIPEPGSLALMGLGLGALGLIRRRKLAAA